MMITKSLHSEDAKNLDEMENEEITIFSQNISFGNEAKVVENKLGRFLKFNNNYQGGKIQNNLYEGNIPYMNYFFIAPAIKNDIKNILILGFGTGYFANQLKSILPKVKKIDIVEINPELIEIAKNYFDFKSESCIEVKIQDGRVFVRNSEKKYDLIILDIFSASGMDYRYMTKEFFEEINNILTPNGLFASNIFGLTDINSPNNIIFKSLFKTYSSVFNDNIIFPTNYGNYEFYKLLAGFKHDLSDLTNIIIFSSAKEIDIRTSKVLEIMDFLEISLDKYVQDFYPDTINTENAKILLDKDENNPEIINIFFKKLTNKFNEIFDNI